jgi:hypothetical protein
MLYSFHMITTILLAFAGVVIATVVGSFWYSGATPMGRLHMRYLGMDKLSPEEQKQKMESAKPAMAKMYAGQALLSLLVSFSTVFIVRESIHNGVPALMALAFPLSNWLCYVVPAIGTGILWSNCDRSIAWKKFLSDSGFFLVLILLVAVMTSFFS